MIYWLNLLILKIVGAWKPNKDEFYIFKFYQIYLTISFFIFMMTQIITLFDKTTKQNWDHIKAFGVGLFLLMIFVKRLNVMYQQENILKVIKALKNDDPFKIENQNEYYIQNSYHRLIK